jgi:competence ComEA-like helix-hairpin-helix protein
MRIPPALAFVAALPVATLGAVNVNTAQQSELQRAGFDAVRAKAIIEWRAANGSIDNFAQLKQVPGFTPDVIEKAKPLIAFNGPAYTPPPKASRKKGAGATLARRAPEWP